MWVKKGYMETVLIFKYFLQTGCLSVCDVVGNVVFATEFFGFFIKCYLVAGRHPVRVAEELFVFIRKVWVMFLKGLYNQM